MKEFFVSDLHIGHENCLRFDNRPFKDLAEQNEKMVEIWNKRVKPEDHVWMLGDILWFANKEYSLNNFFTKIFCGSINLTFLSFC